VKVAVLIVDEFMASLNVMATVADVGTFVAPFAGLTALTSGGALSCAGSPFPPPPPHATSRGKNSYKTKET
jgi:hypothetical protein